MSDNSTASGSAGFTSLLLVAFIVLKLCHVINWSWWWVLSPFWIPLVIAIPFVIIAIKNRKNNYDNFMNKRGSSWEERIEEMKQRHKQRINN